MISHNLYFQIIFRVLLITAVALGAGWAFATYNIGWLNVALIVTEISLTVNLISYLNSTNLKMSYFLEAIQNHDSTLKFPENINGKPIRELYQRMNKVNEQIQQLKIESQQREHYFQALLEHAATGIVTFDQHGFILHANSAAKKVLSLEVLTHVRQIERVNAVLFQTILNIKPLEQRLVSVSTEHGTIQLSLKATSFKSGNEDLTILSIQDIRNELDEKELDSWLKLIRVLMHEIMNSIAPITSLSESLYKQFVADGQPVTPEEISEKTIETTLRGLNVIKEQGHGLMSFVESYRKLTRLPKPDKKLFKVADLLSRIKVLYQSLGNSEKVELSISVSPPNLELFADEGQVSLVLINLIKNALEANESNPGGKIKVIAKLNGMQRPEIYVADNGPGIPEEIIDEIFVPFFTTRENGCGIGLSISKQILRLHGGSLKVRSYPNQGTEMIVTF
jgi:two-component system, NtrC family, nitrogen regulation sensor histidine kinase NtrY